MSETYQQEVLAGHNLPDNYNQTRFNRDFDLVQRTLEEDYAEYYSAIEELRAKWTGDEWDPSYYEIARSIRSGRIKRGRAAAAVRREG